MLADCLATDRIFGVIFRPEGVGERELPPGHVGCAAQIERTESLPDGRANVLLAGTHRFTLERFEHTDRPYHVATVSGYDDTDDPAPSLVGAAARVRELFDRVARAARTLADDSDSVPALPEDPGLLAFAIAAVIDMDVMARQRLLTSRSPANRLQEIELLLTAALDSLELRAVVHARAKSNGHGPHSGSAN